MKKESDPCKEGVVKRVVKHLQQFEQRSSAGWNRVPLYLLISFGVYGRRYELADVESDWDEVQVVP
jgi:hypothetical protein